VVGLAADGAMDDEEAEADATLVSDKLEAG
jgi:hypothetical protein